MGCNMANRFLSLVLILYLSTFRLGKADVVCLGSSVNCTPSTLDVSTCCNGLKCLTHLDTGTSKCSYCTSDSNLCGDGITDCCDGYFCVGNTCTCAGRGNPCSDTNKCCEGENLACFHDASGGTSCMTCISFGGPCEPQGCCEGLYCEGKLYTCGHLGESCNDANFCCEGGGLTCFDDSSGSGDVKCVACTPSGHSCGDGIADCCEGYSCNTTSSTPTCSCSNLGDPCGTTLNCCEEYTCVANGTGSTCSDCIKRGEKCDSSSDSNTC